MSTTANLKNEYESKKYDELLKDIYLDENKIEYQRTRYVNALTKFEELFGEDDVEI